MSAHTRTRAALGAFAASRVVVWAAGLSALALFGKNEGWFRFDLSGVTADGWLAPAARWDAVWFLAVARDGYVAEGSEAFFPLYPLLIRALGGSLEAGVLISVAAATVALAVVHRLTELELGSETARRAVLVTAFFPTAFFLSAVYSEALFLALSAGAFLAGRTDRWWLAGLLGGLAASTRSIGVLILVPLLMMGPPSRLRPALALIPAGLAAYMLSLGDPLAPFTAQEVWGREPGFAPWRAFTTFGDGAMLRRQLVDLAFLAFAVVALVGVWRRLPRPYAAWCAIALAVPLSAPVDAEPLLSLPRFVLVLFPMHMWLATTRAVHPLAAVPLAVFSGMFACWEWVA